MSVPEKRASYLLVEISPPYSLPIALSIIQQIAEVCKSDDLNKVLVNAMAITENITTFDRYQIGIEIARRIGPPIKTAIVLRPNLITYVGENTAVNRYAKLKAFTTIEAAQQWLEISVDAPARLINR